MTTFPGAFAMQYRTCGRSGLSFSALTLGLMVRDSNTPAALESFRQTVLRAVDQGITSIDLATGYKGGAVERAMGGVIKSDLQAHRDSLVLATKGAWAQGTRKAIAQSLELSLKQLGLDHVDLFYHHAPDAQTPWEETAGALDLLFRQGKTRYVGISNYSPVETLRIMLCFKELGTPCIIHQPNYNMLNRWIEDGLLSVLEGFGMGAAVFVPLAQGLLADRCVEGPPEGSRAAGAFKALTTGVPTGEPAYGKYPAGQDVGKHILAMLKELQAIARERGQTLSQLALAWVLRDARVATAIVGMSNPQQVDANAAAAEKLELSEEHRARIASIVPPRWGLR